MLASPSFSQSGRNSALNTSGGISVHIGRKILEILRNKSQQEIVSASRDGMNLFRENGEMIQSHESVENIARIIKIHTASALKRRAPEEFRQVSYLYGLAWKNRKIEHIEMGSRKGGAQMAELLESTKGADEVRIKNIHSELERLHEIEMGLVTSHTIGITQNLLKIRSAFSENDNYPSISHMKVGDMLFVTFGKDSSLYSLTVRMPSIERDGKIYSLCRVMYKIRGTDGKYHENDIEINLHLPVVRGQKLMVGSVTMGWKVSAEDAKRIRSELLNLPPITKLLYKPHDPRTVQ